MNKKEYRKAKLEQMERQTVALEGIASLLAGIRRDTMDIAIHTNQIGKP